MGTPWLARLVLSHLGPSTAHPGQLWLSSCTVRGGVGGRAAGPPAPQPSVGAQFSLVNHGRQSRGVLGKDNEDLHARAGGVLSSPHQNPLEGPGPGGSGNSAPVRHREWARGQRKGKSSPRARGGGGKCGTSGGNDSADKHRITRRRRSLRSRLLFAVGRGFHSRVPPGR